MNADKTIACMTWVSDGRCPDGCCGHISLIVKSPKTGKIVECEFVRSIADVMKYVRSVLPLTHEGRESREGIVKFSAADLRTLVAAGSVGTDYLS